MKKRFATLGVVLFLVVGGITFAHAYGIGLNMKDSDSATQSSKIPYSLPIACLIDRLVGIDLTLDTAVAKDILFNFRMNLECDKFNAQRDFWFRSMSYNVNRLIWSNTFGFGLVRTSIFRLWIGPQVMLGYEYRDNTTNISDAVFYNKFGTVLGANIHAGDSVTLSFELGFRSGFGLDLSKMNNNTMFGSKIEPILGFKLIFRTWDTYRLSNI